MQKATYLFFLCSLIGFSQNVQFSDADLLTYLITKNCVDTDGDGVFDSTADFNNDDQIQLSEAQQVLRFNFNTLAHNIEDLGGFENFSNLEFLEVTTIDVTHLDFSVWPSLQGIRLSSDIDSFIFNNPLLTSFELQNVGFNNPLFDLTNLPNLEYVRIQSNHLTDNLIFGTHNNLEELNILAGTYSTLNLSGMPALKQLVIDDFIGTSLDISNNIILEDFHFRYTTNLTEIIGDDASPYLESINFVQDDYANSPSSLDLTFNNQALIDLKIRGVNSISISNNTADIGDIEMHYINGPLSINNVSFTYYDSLLNGSVFISNVNSEEMYFENINGLRYFQLQDISTTIPMDLSTVETERVFLSSCNLTELNLKNGDALELFYCNSATAIQFICVDRDELNIVENGYNNSSSPVVIHPYCTFVLGGDYYEVNGSILVDLGNGCLTYTDGSIFDVQFTVTDGMSTDSFYADNLNNYSFTLPEGNHTFSSQLIDSDLWTISPSSINLDFPADSSPYIQDFCISPNGSTNDLEIVIIPIGDAIPGFETDYKITYKNKGNTMLSGSIDFTYDDNLMDLITATPSADAQTTGILTWNYTDLLPFETREISLSMLLNTPTDPDFPLNLSDVLDYTVSINPIEDDETPNDNTFELNDVVVNSFDPNDIRCLEGETIALDQVGEYVHYRIRFENTGTSNAINIVVKDVIDTSTLDVSTLIPLNASHDFYTRIVNDNEVEFIFENIQLPFDDANNDGYVLFKIKTVSSLVLGDTFDNEAEIYFDYNFPIITNNETTTVDDNLSINEYELENSLQLYPNPTLNSFTLKSPNHINIERITILDISGKTLMSFTEQEYYNIEALNNGLYFINIKTDTSETTKKLIKK